MAGWPRLRPALPSTRAPAAIQGPARGRQPGGAGRFSPQETARGKPLPSLVDSAHEFRAVIFDIYGTLLEVGPPPPDADARWQRLCRHLLQSHPPLSRLRFLRRVEQGDCPAPPGRPRARHPLARSSLALSCGRSPARSGPTPAPQPGGIPLSPNPDQPYHPHGCRNGRRGALAQGAPMPARHRLQRPALHLARTQRSAGSPRALHGLV